MPAATNGSAERMRRYRERRHKGIACVVQVPIYTTDVEKLIEERRLPVEESNESRSIAKAVELLVDDFVKGWLVGPARPM